MFNSSSVRARLGAGVIAATVAAGLSLPSASLTGARAQAAAAPTCKTPEVLARMRELLARIARYEERVTAQKAVVAQAQRDDAANPDPNRSGSNTYSPLLQAEKKLAELQATLAKFQAQYDALFRLPPCEDRDLPPVVGDLSPYTYIPGISFSGGAGYSNLTSVAKFFTTADTFKTTSNFNLVNLRAMMAAGRYYSSTEISFGGPATSGSFSDTFNAFPAANFSGNVTSGTAFLVTQDLGFNFIQVPGLKAGPFVGYHLFTETLSGSNAAFPAVETSILNDRWQAARVGVGFDKTFLDGGSSISMSFVGMPFVQYQSGAFTADGWGLQGNVAITLPIPGLQPGFGVSLFARDTYMTVSGNTGGPFSVPMDVKNNNFTAGVRLNLNFSNLPSGVAVRVP
jgi:hypothetical protein